MRSRQVFRVVLLCVGIATWVPSMFPAEGADPELPDEMGLHYNRRFHRNPLPGCYGERAFYVISSHTKDDAVTVGLTLMGLCRMYRHVEADREVLLLDSFTMRYEDLKQGQLIPFLGALYRLNKCGPGLDPGSAGAGLIKLNRETMPPGLRHPLDEAALPVGGRLSCGSMGKKVMEGDRSRSVRRFGKYTPGIGFELEKITPAKDKENKPTAYIKSYLSCSSKAGVWDVEHGDYHAKPLPYQEGDVIRFGIGGVKFKIESIPKGQEGKVAIQEIAPRSERRPPHKREYEPDKIELGVGKSGNVATVRIQIVKLNPKTEQDAPTIDVKAWGDPDGKRFVQDFAKVAPGDTIIVYRNYCAYRVHAIIPPDLKHKLVGWVELVPLPNPLE